MWHGDLIFSKAESEHVINLWHIDDFDSKLPPPAPIEAPSIPILMKNTRSSFCKPSNTTVGYTTLLKLAIPSKYNIFFTRFAIFPGSTTKNPVLAFLNSDSQIYFWDLDRFIEYRDSIDSFPAGDSNTPATAGSDTASQASDSAPRSHPFLKPYQHRNHKKPLGRPRAKDSPAVSISTTISRTRAMDSPAVSTTGSFASASENPDTENKGKVNWAQSRADWVEKYDMSESHRELEAHHTVTIPDVGTTNKILGRQMAWSPDGKWCVGAGSMASIVLLTRWEGREEEG